MGDYQLRHPFGEECCEAEIAILKDMYSNYFFEHTPFNKDALNIDTYLIVGRRGTGKSSLAHFFTFQQEMKNAICIDVDEPNEYYNVLSQVSKLAAATSEVAIARIVNIWKYLIWLLIFEKLKDEDIDIAKACLAKGKSSRPAYLIRETLKFLINRFAGKESSELTDELEGFLSEPVINVAKRKALQLTKHKPIIIAIDSLERYAVDDFFMMRATAALVQCVSDFNIEHSREGIHVKAFISAEVFPYLCESEITNTQKYVRDPLFLLWRPKDLVRLVCWRFYKYLEASDYGKVQLKKNFDWSSFSDVLNEIWIPYFGDVVVNSDGFVEKTFPYVIRHTQMRPRQLITLLNAIAKSAMTKGTFPRFDNDTVVTATRDAEKSLATEVINSYARAHKNVGKILDALTGIPLVFKGKLLDKKAPTTASSWVDGNYSPANFKQVLTELGVVGRVRQWNKQSRIIEADFEYALDDRLPISSDDDCVIHPMFVKKLRINTVENNAVIYPFPDHPEYQDFRAARFTKT